MKCLDCGRTFRIAQAKNWKEEQLCFACYKIKHKLFGLPNVGSGRSYGRIETKHGFIRGTRTGTIRKIRKTVMIRINKKNVSQYVKFIEILSDRTLDPNRVLLGARRNTRSKYSKPLIPEIPVLKHE